MYLEKVIETTENAMIMDAGDYISAVACIISIGAAIVSFVSYRLSRKQYKLQLKMYTEGLSNFNFQIIDSCVKDNKEYDKIQYWFNLLITNISDKQTSIVEYVLKLDCLGNLTYTPEFVDLKERSNLDIVSLGRPQNIEAHSSVRGWCIFELPRDTFKELSIEKCRICIRDIHDKMDCQTAIYIEEELINYEV